MFAMFGATVLVPAITGLPVSTTLLFAGIGTLLFHLITKFKVPAFLGSSFAFIGGYLAVVEMGGSFGLTATQSLPYACIGVASAGFLYFILAALFGGRMAYKWRISLDKMLDVLIYGTLAGIIGARAYYVIFQWDYYKLHPAEIPQIWQGGLAIYGGIIAGLLAALIVCKVRKINILNLLDMGGISLLIGQGIGRWGNFMNQEAFGTNTDAPWGMWSKKIAATIIQDSQLLAEKGITMDPNKPVHPTFLYESLWCLIGFLILYVIYKKFRKFSGQLFLGYGAWYGLGRMIIEGFRTDSLYIAHTTIRVSQVVSGVLMLVCLVLYIVFTVKYTKHPKPIEGVDYFPEDAVKTKKERLADEAAAMQAQTEETSAEKSEEVSEEAPEKEPEEKIEETPEEEKHEDSEKTE